MQVHHHSYDAVIVGGSPTPDRDEVTDVGSFTVDELRTGDLNEINRHLLAAASLV